MNPSADLGLGWALDTLMQLQGYAVDRVKRSDLQAHLHEHDHLQHAVQLAQALGLSDVQLMAPDPARLPLLILIPATGWGIVQQYHADGSWTVLHAQGQQTYPHAQLSPTGLYLHTQAQQTTEPPRFHSLIEQTLQQYRGVLIEGVIATLAMGFLALAISLFSMQVYDRVIPTQNTDTLLVLASGVVLFIVLELILKFARAKIMDSMVIGVDQQWSRDIFQRLLSIRVDQLPNSVGSLAAQIRAYEQVRSFYTASTLFHLAELPIALIFLILIAALGTTELAVVPCVAVMVAVMVGAYAKRRVDVLAAQGLAVTHRKTGLLVETVEGIETIKSGVGSWRFLSRWLDVTQHSIGHDLALRHNSDALQYGVAAIQQLSYVAMIMVGALAVIEQHMSIGALIACSILSGRVLSPILSLPQLMVQRAQAKAAILGLEQLYALNVDNQGIARPLTPQRLYGHYRLDQVNFAYPQRPNALRIPQLQIKAGERIAIIGAIGSGKSTLLKLLAGLYQPEQGSVLIDGLDMQHLHPHTRGEHIGYLQQEHRLFEGTLRDNLWIGLPDQGDAVLYAAMQRSGLIQLVSGHPRGLDLPISEGGKGLSGGQKQLVAFTRLLLGQPQILLLDEPTASLDSVQEQRCIRILSEQLQATQPTLVLVTHKHALLPLVDRIIVMAGHTIVMDGAREQILQQLRQLPTAQPPSTPEMNA